MAAHCREFAGRHAVASEDIASVKPSVRHRLVRAGTVCPTRPRVQRPHSMGRGKTRPTPCGWPGGYYCRGRNPRASLEPRALLAEHLTIHETFEMQAHHYG